QMKRCISLIAAVIGLAPLAANYASASDRDDVMATVKQYDEAFNKNDMKAWRALCADNAIIIDDFAPHVWQGADACGDWWNAFGASAKDSGIANASVILGEPWHVTITGDRAYAVYPTQYTYRLKGKPVSEHGVWTLVLQKLSAGWRIAGWAW